MTCEETTYFGLGVSIGLLLAMALLYMPLQFADKKLNDRIDKIEKIKR